MRYLRVLRTRRYLIFGNTNYIPVNLMVTIW